MRSTVDFDNGLVRTDGVVAVLEVKTKVKMTTCLVFPPSQAG